MNEPTKPAVPFSDVKTMAEILSKTSEPSPAALHMMKTMIAAYESTKCAEPEKQLIKG